MHHVARRATIVCRLPSSSNFPSCWRLFSSKQRPRHDPLNVLFCGADDFSIHSLRALHRLQHERPDVVESIDVVCRPDKRVGRGLKHVRQVPIKGAAGELALPFHQIDTFQGWSPPRPINLVVAVSFGLLVPSRVLSAARYGGLNVHPSLLPDLRGPAPIVHTLLKRRQHTGVSLQTMHPTKFDHGTILAQTPPPGIPVSNESTPEELLKTLAPLGAEMLCRALEDGGFLQPSHEAGGDRAAPDRADYAPKISPEDRRIDWTSWTSEEVVLRDRVLGRLWDMETYSKCFPALTPKRVRYQGPWTLMPNTELCGNGDPVVTDQVRDCPPSLGFAAVDGNLVLPASATIDGDGKGKGMPTLLAGLRKSRAKLEV